MNKALHMYGNTLAVLAGVALLLAAPRGGAADNAANVALEKLYNGNALYNMKLYAAATAEYRGFLAASPQHEKVDEARYGLALALYAAGNFAEAEPFLKQLLAGGKFGDKQQVLVLLGDCVNRLRGPAEAEKIFADPAAMQGNNAYYRDLALVYLTDSLARQKKWKETVEAADRALKILPKDGNAARVGYQGAYAHYQLKQMDVAAAAFRALLPAVANTPLETQTAFLLGESLRESGKPEAAEPAYAQAAAKATGEMLEESLFRLGLIRFTLGRHEEAAKTLLECLAVKPATPATPPNPATPATPPTLGNRVPEANLYLGRAYLEKSNFGPAEQSLVKVSKPDGVLAAEATLWLSRNFSRQKRLDEALKVLAENLPRFSGDPLLADLLFEQAGLFMAQQKYAEAAGAFGRIAGERAQWPRLDEVLRLHALCAHRTKDYRGSIALCDRFMTAAPKHSALADVLFLKAENQYLLDPAKPEEALKLYKEFQTKFPKEPNNGDAASLRIGRILQGSGAWKEALECLLPLRARPPKEGDDKVFSEVSFLIGDCYFRLEQWAQAVELLDAYVKMPNAPQPRPNVDTALLEMALAHVRLNKPEAAIPNLEQLISGGYPKSPHLPLALSELGRLYYEGKKAGEARQRLQRLVSEFAESPQRSQAEYYLGWINVDAKTDKPAEANFLEVLKRSPQDPLAADSRLQLGLILLRTERFNDAVQHLSELRKSFPAFAKLDEATYSAGVASARLGQHDQAIQLFKEFLEKFPKAVMADRAAYELAWCHRRANRNQDAVKGYDFLLKTYPQSPVAERARFEMAELCFEAKDFDAAIVQLKQSIAGAADKGVKEQAMFRLGWTYINKGDTAAATAFEAMIAEFPQSERLPTARYQAGEMRVKLKEFAPALVHFTAALAHPQAKEIRESAMIRQGEMQIRLDKFAEANNTYQQFQNEFPTSKWIQQARFGTGWAAENQRQYDKAIADYRKVLAERATDEPSARAQFQIGECLFALKRYDEALQELVRVDVNYKFPAWSSKAIFEIARVLDAKGDRDRAVEQYRAVMERFPKEDVAVAARTRLLELQAAGAVITPSATPKKK